jgi:hypothetical protein
VNWGGKYTFFLHLQKLFLALGKPLFLATFEAPKI